jgi:hypothetical protein
MSVGFHASSGLSRVRLGYRLRDGTAQCTLTLVNEAQYVEPQEDHILSSHYYRSRSDSDVGTSVGIGLN